MATGAWVAGCERAPSFRRAPPFMQRMSTWQHNLNNPSAKSRPRYNCCLVVLVVLVLLDVGEECVRPLHHGYRELCRSSCRGRTRKQNDDASRVCVLSNYRQGCCQKLFLLLRQAIAEAEGQRRFRQKSGIQLQDS